MVVASGLVTATAPAASAADVTTYLGESPGTGDVVTGDGKIFIAMGGQVLIANPEGTVTGSVADLSGASHLAITPDRTRIYATLLASNEVAEIDTGDLTVTRRIDLSSYPCPMNLALSGTRLWVGYGCEPGAAGVVGLDLSAPAPEPVRLETGSMLDAPLVAAAGNTLVIGEPQRSVTDLMVYDTSAAPATLRGVISGATGGSMSRLRDLAITADGSMVISAFPGPYRFDAWDTTTLTKVRTYAVDPTPTGYSQAVAISPNGAYIAGVGASPTNISVYDAQTTTKVYAYANQAGEPVPGSFTFSGTDVYGLLKDLRTNRLYLWRLHGATLPASTMTLTVPSTGTAREPLTLTGRLTLPGESTTGAQPLVVTRRLPDGTSTPLPGAASEDGTFTITDTPPVGGTISYDVLWDGDSHFRWSRKSATVTVAKHQSSLTLTGPAGGVAGKQLQFSGALDTGGEAAPMGASLTVQRTYINRKGTSTTSLPAVTPGSDGTFSFTDTPSQGGQYTYTVQWAGDAASLPAQGSHDVEVQGGLG